MKRSEFNPLELSLEAPYLPQMKDGCIDKALIANMPKLIVVQAPHYYNMSYGDIITGYFGSDIPSQPDTVRNPDMEMFDIFFHAEDIPTGSYEVWYTADDRINAPRASQPTPVLITEGHDQYKVYVTPIVDFSPADGKSENCAVATLTNSGAPLKESGIPMTFQVDGSARIVESTGSPQLWQTVTDSNGTATVHFTDTQAESVYLTATARGSAASSRFIFNPVDTVYHVKLVKTADNRLANGLAENEATATVTKNGQIAPDESLIVSVTGSAKFRNGLSHDRILTGKGGCVTVPFTDTVAESPVVLMAWSPHGAYDQKSFTFLGSSDYVVCVETTLNNRIANGKSADEVTAIVTKNGRGSDGESISFIVTGSARFTENNRQTLDTHTGNFGLKTVSVVNTVAETVIVTAISNGVESNPTSVTFKPDDVYSVTLKTTLDNQVADGNKMNQVTAIVYKNGIFSYGEPIVFGVTGSAKFVDSNRNTLETTTEAYGVKTVSLTDIVAETVIVTAISNGVKSNPTSVTFKPDDVYSVTLKTTLGNRLIRSQPNSN